MFENIVNRALRKTNSLFVINDGADRYIERLSYLKRKIYLANDISDIRQYCGSNSLYIRNVPLNRIPFDEVTCILVFGRSRLYQLARTISMQHHIPVVIIDRAGTHAQVVRPFFTTPTVSKEELTSVAPDMIVGVTKLVSQQWRQVNPFAIHIAINPPPIPIVRTNPTKILVEDLVPDGYLEAHHFPKELITRNPQEAAIFLHLMEHTTELLIDCFASGIPVVTFESPELDEYAKHKCIIKIDSIQAVHRHNFIAQIEQAAAYHSTINNAKEYIKYAFTINNFLQRWEAVLNYFEHKVFHI